ncbi:MAG: TetR/AcrR family transcriptional regulator [Lachnospiraceae bacterium]|nr:TetR/AcrR family transcriptional regulator [Lachnospiraceae bacterium]
MDRRQKKTREAILQAFARLLPQKSYHKITVQDIIDAADVGRTTFYAHFETKDDLLKELCQELFAHIIDTAMDCTHTHGLYSDTDAPNSVFLHLLLHLQENDRNILGLLSCESSEIFLRYFKDSLQELIRVQLISRRKEQILNETSVVEKIALQKQTPVPEDFLINHISGSFVEMVLWWLKGGQKQTPEELDHYFEAVISGIL